MIAFLSSFDKKPFVKLKFGTQSKQCEENYRGPFNGKGSKIKLAFHSSFSHLTQVPNNGNAEINVGMLQQQKSYLLSDSN